MCNSVSLHDYAGRAKTIIGIITLMKNQDKAFLVVEGSTDKRYLRTTVVKGNCQIFSGNARNVVLEVVKYCEAHEWNFVVGIVDADFCRATNTWPDLHNIFYTDTHDLETLAMRTSGGVRAIGMHLTESKDNDYSTLLRGKVLLAAFELGLVRLWVHIEKAKGNIPRSEYSFKAFKVTSSLRKLDLTLDLKKLSNNLNARWSLSGEKRIDAEAIVRQLRPQFDKDKWQIANGHDICSFLTHILSKKDGVKSCKGLKQPSFERLLLCAFTFDLFKETKLFCHMQEWGRDNAPRSLL